MELSLKPTPFFQVEILEELRRARVDDLATLIQKTYRGFSARQKMTRLRDSQVVISTYYKRGREKSHITDLKERRKAEWAAILIQRTIRAWLVSVVHALSVAKLLNPWECVTKFKVV